MERVQHQATKLIRKIISDLPYEEQLAILGYNLSSGDLIEV